MTDFGWSWNKGGKQTAAVSESEERRADRLAYEQNKIDLAVTKERLRSLRANAHLNPGIIEAAKLTAWNDVGQLEATPNPDAPGGFDVKHPDGWPPSVKDPAAFVRAFADARGFAVEADE